MLQQCVERAVFELHGNASGPTTVFLRQRVNGVQYRRGDLLAIEKIERDNMLTTQRSAQLQVAINSIKKKSMNVAIVTFDRHDSAGSVATRMRAPEVILGVSCPLSER